jgi:hypothetical protein
MTVGFQWLSKHISKDTTLFSERWQVTAEALIQNQLMTVNMPECRARLKNMTAMMMMMRNAPF